MSAVAVQAGTRTGAASNANGCRQASSEKDFQTKLNLPDGLLKLYSTITKIGRNR